jgi:hypothetical protein
MWDLKRFAGAAVVVSRRQDSLRHGVVLAEGVNHLMTTLTHHEFTRMTIRIAHLALATVCHWFLSVIPAITASVGT